MDETSVDSIQATGIVSRPDEAVYEKALSRGQFTSPVCVELKWVILTGFVANDDQGVRVLVIEERGDIEPIFHEVRHDGRKIEGPGLFIWPRGNDLRYVVTEHENVTTSPRINGVYRGVFSGVARPPDPRPSFTDVDPFTELGQAAAALAQRGIMSGYSLEGGLREFRPGAPLTRGQLALIVARLYGWV